MGDEQTLLTTNFESFWSEYPRKTGKPAARESFARALKKHAMETVIHGCREWAKHWKVAGTEDRYIPHPSTWLNQERYFDKPPTKGATVMNYGTRYG